MIHTICSNKNETYVYEKETYTSLIKEPIIGFATYKHNVYAITKYNKLYTFAKNDYSDRIECIRTQIIYNELTTIVYINTQFNDKDMSPELILLDDKWNYYTYQIDYDGFVETTQYVKKGCFYKSIGNLCHAFQRDMYWYIFRTDEEKTYLDIYFPDKSWYESICIGSFQLLDVLIHGYIAIILSNVHIYLYHFITHETSILMSLDTCIKCKGLFMRCPNSYYLVSEYSIYQMDIEHHQMNEILTLTIPIDILCYPEYNIKSNTNAYIFPYVSSIKLNKNSLLWKNELTQFQLIQDNLYNIKPIEFEKQIVPKKISLKFPIDTSKNTLVLDTNLEHIQNSDNIHFTKWLTFMDLKSNTCTPFYDIQKDILNKIIVEFVKNKNTYGSSFMVYVHPKTNLYHFVPDHSDWFKLISFEKDSKIPIQLYAINDTRTSFICRMIKGQQSFPFMY